MLSGIFAALTTSYLLGRFVCRPLLRFFKKRQRFANVLETSLQLMDKYRKFSLLLSYFIPGLRSFVPFLYGFSRLPFRSFALYAYSGAFIWLGADVFCRVHFWRLFRRDHSLWERSFIYYWNDCSCNCSCLRIVEKTKASKTRKS
ncbi:VTT domain-containing protein [Neobacillus sp. PS3-34]|uniref:DedA family protein n=1 Tax=Neobacillus sp. PS3-34 TaxID=3070678 RepID=UPI0027E02226|nr:VTT domain-containing protein [Neobacillus sp. PS3-34]WML47090.1 VTT domain-containing protein [Neobacillus sp. PS3-34]